MHNGWDADYFPSIPVGLRTACCLLLRKEEGGKKKRKRKTNPVKCSDVVITEQFLGFERLVCTLPLCRSNKTKYKIVIKKKDPQKMPTEQKMVHCLKTNIQTKFNSPRRWTPPVPWTLPFIQDLSHSVH